jgi:hypothetical protein
LKTHSDYALPDPSGLLPDRPIAVRHPGFADHRKMPFLGLIFLAFFLGVGISALPGLYSDYRILRAPVEVSDAEISNAGCRSRKLSINCKADILYRRDGTSQTRSVSFSFVEPGFREYESVVLAERGNPDNLTLSLAIEKFWNRLACALGMMALFGILGVYMLRRYGQLSATIKAFKQPAILQPVWARVTHRADKRGTSRITYAAIGTPNNAAVVSDIGKTETAWIHYDPVQDETFTLAAVHPHAPFPALLDEQMERLDLNLDEAAKARARRDALLSPEPVE